MAVKQWFNDHRLSKALFKQCLKTNGLSWLIITILECVMVASIMVITGGDSIGVLISSIRDSVMKSELDGYVGKMSLNFYSVGMVAETKYDSYFVSDFDTCYKEVKDFTPLVDEWYENMPTESSYATAEEYQEAYNNWMASKPTSSVASCTSYATSFVNWIQSKPSTGSIDEWSASRPTAEKFSKETAVASSNETLTNFYDQYAQSLGYKQWDDNWIMVVQAGTGPVCPMDNVIKMYEDNGIELLPDYDVDSLITHIFDNTIDTYLTSAERNEYQIARSRVAACKMAACTLTAEESLRILLNMVEDYGIDEETFMSFGYTYDKVYNDCYERILSYEVDYNYRLELLNAQAAKEGWDDKVYAEKVQEMMNSLVEKLAGSFLSSLPEDVSGAIEEVGQMDIYGLIVGYIFYKIAGLLLPMIYMILGINNMVAGSVDSGSMAYVISTGTRRESVTLTQGLFMTISLFLMFLCTTATSVTCYLTMHGLATSVTLGGIFLMNLGAFLVLFALSGFCFAVSCFCNRSRFSLAIGGGLTIFALVATIVGMFGSEIVPSIIRFDALNVFNYFSIITLFDVMDITRNSVNIYWKLAILLVIGIAGYVIGTVKFKKKDLPL